MCQAGRGAGGEGARSFPEAKAETKESRRRRRPHTRAHSRSGAHGTGTGARSEPASSEQRAGGPRAEPAEQPASRARDDPTPPRPVAAPRRPVSPPPSLTHGAEEDSESECPGQAWGDGARFGSLPTLTLAMVPKDAPGGHGMGGCAGIRGTEMPAGPAGIGQVRWEQGQVPGDLEAGAPLRARAGAAPESLGGDPSRAPDLPQICALLSRLDFARRWSSFGPCHAVFSPRPFFYVLASPGSLRGQERCGGPAAFLLDAVGLFFISSAVGSCSDP